MTITQLAGTLTETLENPRYLPILKSRQGELTALAKLGDQGAPIEPDLTPIVEIVEMDFTGDARDRAVQVEKLVRKMATAWPVGRPRIVVDTLGVELDPDDVERDPHGDPIGPEVITPELITALRSAGLRAVPALRLSDTESYREGVRHLLDWSHEPGACLRIGGEDLDDQVVPLDQAVEDMLDGLGLDPMTVDLVLDFSAIEGDNHLAMASRLARFVLPTLDRQPWRSFALGSGAFPVNLGEVSAYTVAEVPRRDRQLWMQLQPLRLRRRLDYADYAVTHPLLQTGVAFAAPPQIRYTSTEHWLVAKGRRTDRRGHAQFFDLCERLRRERRDEIAPRNRTWGDEEFHIAAEKAGTDGDRPGNASTWRAIATSHHIGHVLHGLRVRGEP